MADTLITGTTLIEDKRSERGEVWSCAGIDFFTSAPDQHIIERNLGGDGTVKNSSGGNLIFSVGVHLPNGAKVTSVIIYGEDGADVCAFSRTPNSSARGTAELMATSTLNSETTTITSEIINNEDYRYYLSTETIEFTHEIYGARIKYTY